MSFNLNLCRFRFILRIRKYFFRWDDQFLNQVCATFAPVLFLMSEYVGQQKEEPNSGNHAEKLTGRRA